MDLTSQTLLRRMAEWTASLRWEDIPERVRAKARLQTLSVLAAVHSAAGTEPGRMILSAAREWAGKGPCTLLPSGDKTSLAGAVFAGAALSVAQDYDDYLLFGHTGHSAVLVPLLLGEQLGSSLTEVLTAQVAANELAGRLGAAVLLGPHNGQTWSFIHLLAAAGAGAKLLHLTAEQTAHALAVSLYQPTYTLYPGFMGPDSKLLTPSGPAVLGVQAALLAAKGFTGALDLLENRQGFLRHLSYYPLPFMLSGWGRAWVTDTLAYKIYPGCAYIDTTVDAVLQIRQDYRAQTGRELDPATVQAVKVEATALTVEMDALSRIGETFDVLNPVSVNFSIPGNVAIALLKGRLTGEDLERSALQREGAAIRRLADTVTLVHDVSLTARMVSEINRVLHLNRMRRELRLLGLWQARRRMQQQYGRHLGLGGRELVQLLAGRLQARKEKGSFPGSTASRPREPNAAPYDLGECNLENFRLPFAARVTITLRDGATLSRRQDLPLGGPGYDFNHTRMLIQEKYRREASRRLSAPKVQALVDASERWEELGRAADLIRLVKESPVD